MKWLQEKAADLLTSGGAAAGLGAIFTGLTAFWVKIRSQKRIDYQQLLLRLDREVAELREEVKQLRTEKEERDKQLTILRAGRFELPVPMWLKDRQGRYLDFNLAFEKLLLIPNRIDPHTVMGKTDHEIWPHFADYYRKNDLEVMRTRTSTEQIEEALIDGITVKFKSIKYPYTINFKVAGVGGIAFQID